MSVTAAQLLTHHRWLQRCNLFLLKHPQPLSEGHLRRKRLEVAPIVRTDFYLFKVKTLPVVRLPVQPLVAS